VELEACFLITPTSQVLSLQPLLAWAPLFMIVPNNPQRMKLGKKSEDFDAVSLHCSVQKSRVVFSGEIPEL